MAYLWNISIISLNSGTMLWSAHSVQNIVIIIIYFLLLFTGRHIPGSSKRSGMEILNRLFKTSLFIHPSNKNLNKYTLSHFFVAKLNGHKQPTEWR